MPGSRSLHPIPPALLAHLVEQTPALVLLTDRDGRIVYVNEGFTEMTGYTAEEALGRSPRLLKSGLREQDFYAHLWETVLSGRSWNMLVPNRRKDGSVYWQQTNIFPLRDEDGRIVYLAGVGRDVSDRVKMTEEIAAARDAAEAAARVKSEFLVNMSHEIRTPLNAVLGMADLLGDTDLDPRQRGQLDVLRTAGESLLGLVNEIMDLSTLEAGGMTLEDQSFDLRDLLEGAASVVAPMAHARGLELLLDVDPRVDGRWRGDPGRVRQVVMNLLSNAVKFTEGGEVEIVATPLAPGQEGGLHIAVRDTGIGIPPERLEGVFERFTQLDSSSTRRYGGSGLGLALCRELCTLMNGRLHAESEVGVGSTFHVEVPLHRIEPHAPELPLQGGRVVVADDHPRHRAILRDLLERSGASVTEVDRLAAVDGVVRTAAERDRAFGVVVIDDTWGEGDVETTIDRLAGAPYAPGVVLVTRVQDAHDPGEAVHERVVQPTPRSRLVEAVCRARRRGDAARGARQVVPPEFGEGGTPRDWPHRVLVVDDNAVNRLLVQALLGKQGSVVEEAECGAEALARLERSPAVDLVLMDLVMPEMDGYATVREVRRREASEGAPGVPIIAFSASTAPREVEAALAAGCDGHVGKPVRKEELVEGIRSVIRRRGTPTL